MANAKLKIVEPSGSIREIELMPETNYTVGRSKDNDVVLNDRRVSRKHAHIVAGQTDYKIVDGFFEGGEFKRSVNRVFINGLPAPEKLLESGDLVTIGETTIEFSRPPVSPPLIEPEISSSSANQNSLPTISPESSKPVSFDDNPLGNTQVMISAREIIGGQSHLSLESSFISPEEIKDLRRKAKILDLLFEMSKTLGTVFDLKEVFEKATDLIFRGTPADRVVALLTDDNARGADNIFGLYPIAVRARDEKLTKFTEKLTISRTITQKVMTDKVVVLSQDAVRDKQFSGSDSIVSQGVRSTICAPLMTESNVHGVLYADRLDPFGSFSADHLELIGAVAAQSAVTVETVKVHKRLAREEVARENYRRFMPEYVVNQLLENPNSFKLGGTNQRITVLFSDIRGFTSIAEHAKPEVIVGILNRYFTAMSEVIFAHGGTLDKYIGDGLMALFGAPTATSDDARNALQTAVEMQKRLVALNAELQSENIRPIEIGIGLHTGEATVGYIGSEKRSEYTAIGDTVNLASRLESVAKGGQILISREAAEASGNLFPLISLNAVKVKNRETPVTPFEVKWN